jgi:hypothetical protein
VDSSLLEPWCHEAERLDVDDRSLRRLGRVLQLAEDEPRGRQRKQRRESFHLGYASSDVELAEASLPPVSGAELVHTGV